MILTLGFANAAALGGPGAQRWEAAAALERQVLATFPEDPEAAGAAVLDAIHTIQQGTVGAGGGNRSACRSAWLDCRPAPGLLECWGSV